MKNELTRQLYILLLAEKQIKTTYGEYAVIHGKIWLNGEVISHNPSVIELRSLYKAWEASNDR